MLWKPLPSLSCLQLSFLLITAVTENTVRPVSTITRRTSRRSISRHIRQEEYFKTHTRVDVSYQSKNVLLTKSLGVLIFTGILFVCAAIAGAATFWQGFWLTFGLMAWIGVYDTCFLDWVLFANLPMFRLEGTEHMDRAYHQKWFHVKGMLFPGTIFALIPAALVGWLIVLVR